MNIYYVAGIPYSTELYHHGIKGQKWGIRRWQNEDGSLTQAGIARYRTDGKRQLQGSLNQLDRDRATISVYKHNTDKKIAKLTKKANKSIERKGQVSEKVTKKIFDLQSVSKSYKNTLKSYADLTTKLMDKANKQGYSVNTKAISRQVTTGKQAAVGILASAASIALSPYTGFFVAGTPYTSTSGTKYKLRRE